MTRFLMLACTCLALGLGLTACGEKEEPAGGATDGGSAAPLKVMLDYFPNADHAGIYGAQAGGHFEQAGLDVEIRQPPDPAAPIK